MTARAATAWMPAHAKLNLYLAVTGRRADGYHTLDTVFHQLDLHDDVAVSKAAEGVTCEVSADAKDLLVPADERNLAVRALAGFRDRVAPDCGFHVRIHKRIPNGGGLGGGSSDAAACLRLANDLVGRPVNADALAALALRIGADVPFFLRGGSQRGSGIGDELSAVEVRARHFVLLSPPYGCATAEVYKIHAGMLAAESNAGTLGRNQVPVDLGVGMPSGLYNHLEAAAERLRPELGRLRRAVCAAGYEHVRMTGSGSTLFVMLEDERAAQRCRADLERALIDTEHAAVGITVTQSAGRTRGDGSSADMPRTLIDPPSA